MALKWKTINVIRLWARVCEHVILTCYLRFVAGVCFYWSLPLLEISDGCWLFKGIGLLLAISGGCLLVLVSACYLRLGAVVGCLFLLAVTAT